MHQYSEYLDSVEINLLRGGEPVPILGVAQSDYRILVSHSQERPKAQLYAFGLRQPIPAFPIPLSQGEPEPFLELQSLLHRAYDRARFEIAINYREPSTPKPSASDWD